MKLPLRRRELLAGLAACAAAPAFGELAPRVQEPHERHAAEDVAAVAASDRRHARTCSRSTFFNTLPAADIGSSRTKLMPRGHL